MFIGDLLVNSIVSFPEYVYKSKHQLSSHKFPIGKFYQNPQEMSSSLWKTFLPTPFSGSDDQKIQRLASLGICWSIPPSFAHMFPNVSGWYLVISCISPRIMSMSNVMNLYQPTTAFYDTGFIVLSVHCQFVKTISFQHFQVFFTATWLYRNTTLMKLAWSRSCRSLLVFSTCCGQPYWKDVCDTAALAALQCWITPQIATSNQTFLSYTTQDLRKHWNIIDFWYHDTLKVVSLVFVRCLIYSSTSTLSTSTSTHLNHCRICYTWNPNGTMKDGRNGINCGSTTKGMAVWKMQQKRRRNLIFVFVHFVPIFITPDITPDISDIILMYIYIYI